MVLTIHPTTTIAEAQAAFGAAFPYLKIDFFTRLHDVGESTWAKYMVLNRQEQFGKLANFTAHDAPFEVTGAMTVADFEQHFQKQFGVGVQVFRKSMGSWLITSTTDTWTLATQNEQGHEDATTLTEMVYTARTNDSALD